MNDQGCAPEHQSGVTAEAALTSRQAEVLECAASGLSGKQIARALGISIRTVHEHMARMRHRPGARTDSELIALAVAAGLVRPDAQRFARSATVPGPQWADGDRSSGRAQHPAFGPDALAAGARIGYIQVSSAGDHAEHELGLLRAVGCRRIVMENGPDAGVARPELAACLHDLGPEDVLVVSSLDRLSPGLPELVAVVSELRRRGAGFVSLREDVDTTGPGGRIIFQVFAALAEFARGPSMSRP